MKMAQIEAFYNVIQSGSISQAARRGHLTQPAVSMQVRDLEERLKLRLLERSNKGVKPTPAGKIVYEYCCKIIDLKQSLKEELEKLQQHDCQG
ncbi:MAG TPA: LysR family transcriptional regulator [Firmicutes bacterium]|nr:LysR family transcriptional regulator [Bacillota bacterium]